MKPGALDILIALPDAGAAGATSAALRRQGHRVAVVDATQIEHAPLVEDVLVCDLRALERLRAAGQRAAAVLVDMESTPEAFRTALRLGASDVLTRPYLLSELVARVESGSRARQPAPARDRDLCINVEAEPDAIEDALRELAGFLIARGISPTTRTRALSACAEVLDNVARHAFAPTQLGRAALTARLAERELALEVRDGGQGFDSAQVACAAAAKDARPAGLARARALSEDLRVESVRGRGTCVTLRFTAYRVDFDEHDSIDLSELDWLPPALARRVLDSLIGDGSEPLYNLSPALAVTVGRLLTGATPRQRAEGALWS